MYTKILIPAADRDFPVILCDGPDYAVLSQELISRGWVPWDSQEAPAGAGEVVIGQPGLSIKVDGINLLIDDVNPIAPPGWWDAVNAMFGCCMVIVVGKELLDFRSPTFAADFSKRVNNKTALYSLLPIRH